MTLLHALWATFLFLGCIALLFTVIVLGEIIIAAILHMHDTIKDKEGRR